VPPAILVTVIVAMNSCPGALQGIRLREAGKARYKQRHNDPIPQAMHLATYRKQRANRSVTCRLEAQSGVACTRPPRPCRSDHSVNLHKASSTTHPSTSSVFDHLPQL